METFDEIDDIYIYVDKENISKEKCEMIINKFNNDERKYKGTTFEGVTEYKKTNELIITGLEDWKEIDHYLYDNLNKALKEYSNRVIKNKSGEVNLGSGTMKIGGHNDNMIDFGYQVQHYKANIGHYHWHTDSTDNINNLITSNQYRIITFIWYLCDVEIGGETEFLNGKIKPEAGKLLLFPATWTYLHRGKMPISNDKYIVCGWTGFELFHHVNDIFQHVNNKNI
jgi:hypothetical protein